jgi:hypothetical protein
MTEGAVAGLVGTAGIEFMIALWALAQMTLSLDAALQQLVDEQRDYRDVAFA